MTTSKAYHLQHLLDGSQVSQSEFHFTTTSKFEPNLEFLVWDMLNKQLLSYIFVFVIDPMLLYVLHFETSRESWVAFDYKFSLLSHSNILKLKNKLRNLKKGLMAMLEYIQQVKKIVDTLAPISSPLEEEDVVLYLLNGLPPEFNPLKTAIRARSQAISVPELHELLLIEDQKL